MPPMDKPQFFDDVALREKIFTTTVNFIDALPTDILERVKKTMTSAKRNIRDKPTTGGSTTCGQYFENDIVYFDPRRDKQVTANGWVWTRVYMLPGHTRLVSGLCKYPKTGIFWVATHRPGGTSIFEQ